ncbi:1-propanol dehydrogenase PduQ [Clostridium coskatii]|uniref:Aldehyde-alcohol dehydrogenase n=1 Tax=Clostridium coskatii TaxID=1705578 RepID=A0A166U937_9CLOT|nr:1-propanol dehydrogenase PduQ [Clostridium coskatii]OAA94703.1 Aldehyde-alcohol dehydrogenase [Clostridium coskatii]OBR93391.1 aldehyde-alcohol dehydrogenase [Clostridium coskatii]
MKNFNIKPKVYFDTDALNHLCELKCKKALIAADPFMVKSSTVDKITEQLDKAHIEYDIFSDIVPDPPVEVIVKGVQEAVKFKPDVLIALGGGSAIDSAKGIMYFCQYVNNELNNETKEPLFIAIPTTSGTGSEVTNFCIVTDKQKGVKYALVDDNLTPDQAVLDIELVKSVPKSTTAETGIDVLTHGIEAYVSTNRSDYSDALAEKSIKMVFKYLLAAYENGDDEEARMKMHNASCIAGMAFTNASLGLNHGMAHALGGKIHIPHGRANGLLLPYVIEYNANLKNLQGKVKPFSAAYRYTEISKFLGLPASNQFEGVRSLIAAVKILMNKLNLPKCINNCEVLCGNLDSEIHDLSITALNDRCTKTNPRVPKIKDVENLFKRVFSIE